MTGNQPDYRTRAFTLIELLVTLVIIVLLVGILIPVVSKVRKSAQAAVVQQQVESIAGAIERFHQEQGRYPGPLPDASLETAAKGLQPPTIYENGSAMPNADHITSSENLLLGLLGGLKFVTTGNQTQLTYDPQMVGRGEIDLKGKKWSAYLPGLPPAQISTGKYSDGSGSADDSDIAEILDGFSSPMPIIYLRARVGANGVIGNSAANASDLQQYDLPDLLPYTRGPAGATTSIGVGKSISRNDYTANFPVQPTPGFWPHGLQTISNITTIHKNDTSNPAKTYVYPYDAYAYLLSPSSTASTPTPRSKDRFILISAGIDRIYGTKDDICSFGDLNP